MKVLLHIIVNILKWWWWSS